MNCTFEVSAPSRSLVFRSCSKIYIYISFERIIPQIRQLPLSCLKFIIVLSLYHPKLYNILSKLLAVSLNEP
jgi:hypothetical protein